MILLFVLYPFYLLPNSQKKYTELSKREYNLLFAMQRKGTATAQNLAPQQEHCSEL